MTATSSNAALLSGTPSAVRDAINKVEGWAIDKTDREAKDITNQLREYYSNEKNLDEALEGVTDKMDDAEEDDMFNEDEDAEEGGNEDHEDRPSNEDDSEEYDNKLEAKSESSLFNTALGHLRTLSSKLQVREDSSIDDLLADLNSSSFVHDRKTTSNTMTLWSSANEVTCGCYGVDGIYLIVLIIVGDSIHMLQSKAWNKHKRCDPEF